MKNTRLTIKDAQQIFPAFLKTNHSKTRIKKLTKLLYGIGTPKYVFNRKKRKSVPIDLRRSFCYRGVSWYIWKNGLNHKRIVGKYKKQIYVFLCMNEYCSEKFIDIASKHNLHLFCSRCKVNLNNFNFDDEI